MKNLVIILVLLFSVTLLSAQTNPHWTFVQEFGGMEDNLNEQNEPFHLELDDYGNAYLYATYGMMADIDGYHLPITNSSNGKGSFLAKFNCSGGLEWVKTIRTGEVDFDSQFMQIKNDTIYIMGTYDIDLYYNTYFFDSMIYAVNNDPPYQFNFRPGYRYNYFASFDLDGNMLDIKYLTKNTYKDFYWADIVPFNVDAENNKYIMGRYRNEWFNGKSVFYLDTTPITDTIEYPYYTNYLLFKFDDNWDLKWHKTFADSLEGGHHFRLVFNDMISDN